MIFLIWSLVIGVVLILYFKRAYSKFSNYGVKHLPIVPVFGNILKSTTQQAHFADVIRESYDAFKDEKYVGLYEFSNPVVIVRDIDLIKKITVQDFDSFVDHRFNINEEIDTLFGSNLFTLKGQKWKEMRSTLSPAFTSSKIRLMVPFITEVGNQMIISLENKMKAQKTDNLVIDIKDICTRYANDVIATCAFGLKVDSLTKNDTEFYKMGKIVANFTLLQNFKFLGFAAMPWLMELLKVQVFDSKAAGFFKSLVLGTMRNREENNILRPDMIHLLMEAKKGSLSHLHDKGEEDAGFATVKESNEGKSTITRVWKDDELVAQALLFLIAGFDTVATAMTFILYELALNPECQEKLVEEINETEKNEGFNYNSIQNMKYLDMVVSEGLRKWPPSVATDRIATKPYNLGKPNDKAKVDFVISKGVGIWMPVMAIHRDADFYENPEKFDPERFSEENIRKINPSAYLPFGIGPRNCIGSRFALCEMKAMIYKLIKHIEVLPCEKTCIPAELATNTFNLRLKGGHWLKIKARNSVM